MEDLSEYFDNWIPAVGHALHAMGIEFRIWRQGGTFETKLLYEYGYAAQSPHWSDEERARADEESE
jgi:hypothetical protein